MHDLHLLRQIHKESHIECMLFFFLIAGFRSLISFHGDVRRTANIAGVAPVTSPPPFKEPTSTPLMGSSNNSKGTTCFLLVPNVGVLER